MLRKTYLLTAFFSLLCMVNGAIIYVPDDYAHIQNAIDASSNGDIVIVRAGFYYETIDFLGKTITVKSESGPASTVINGSQLGSVVTFASGEGSATLLDGFSIVNGKSETGGGIHCSFSNAKVERCVISDNRTEGNDGGFGDDRSGGHGGNGAGICAYDSSLSFTNCVFRDNKTGKGGLGDCYSGGGSGQMGGRGGCGGAILASGSSFEIYNCLIARNATGDGGDGYLCGGGNGGAGGALFCETVDLTNCTLVDNRTGVGGTGSTGIDGDQGDGGGIYYLSAAVTNSILWDNDPNAFGRGVPDVSYSNVEDGTGQTWFDPATCLDTDPLFVAPELGNYLLEQSPCEPGVDNPCVDGGDPSSSGVIGTTRTDGADDFVPVDLGFHVCAIFVPDDYSSIQSAIDSSPLSGYGGHIIVDPGTYEENIDFKGQSLTIKSAQGPLVTTIKGDSTSSVVTCNSNEDMGSVLDGFTVKGGSTASNGGGIRCEDGASPIVMNSIVCNNTAEYGGGLYCDNGSAVILLNTVFANNTADQGGGVCCRYDSTIAMTNITMTGNQATRGGGAYCDRGSRMDVVNSIAWDNSAPAGHEFYLGLISDPSTLAISHSDVMEGKRGVYVASGCTLDWGSGMIDADPELFDPANDDFRLTFDSPCRDCGDNSAPTIAKMDMEGDPRTVLGTVDMGADEYYYHLYHRGQVTPGSPIDLCVVGYPGAPVMLYGGSLAGGDPMSTSYGYFFLEYPPAFGIPIGSVPADGVLALQLTIPPGWSPGSEHPFQCLVGPLGGPWTRLSNLMILTVE